jgi:hypothetical protein
MNEVLSDALKDACAGLVEMPGWKAWVAKEQEKPQSTADEATGLPVDPDALLHDLVRLQEQRLEVSVLVGFVRQRKLSRALDVDDLTAWRAAGIPQEVIAAALERAP